MEKDTKNVFPTEYQFNLSDFESFRKTSYSPGCLGKR